MRTAGFACSSIGVAKRRAGFLGGLFGAMLVLFATLTASWGGTQSWGIRPSRGGGSMSWNRYFRPHGEMATHALLYNGYRLGAGRGYRGPMVIAPRWRSNQDNFAANPGNPNTAPKAAESTPEIKGPSATIGAQPFVRGGQTTQPGSIKAPAGIKLQTLSPSQRSEAAEHINQRFKQAEDKTTSQPWRSQERRGRLEQSRVFFLGLIDDGYPLLLLDTWCDDLLDDQVDTGMPIDLIDLYWGQPVSTQEYVEYYVPYQLCTYQTPDGNFRQVTFQNGVVAQPM